MNTTLLQTLQHILSEYLSNVDKDSYIREALTGTKTTLNQKLKRLSYGISEQVVYRTATQEYREAKYYASDEGRYKVIVIHIGATTYRIRNDLGTVLKLIDRLEKDWFSKFSSNDFTPSVNYNPRKLSLGRLSATDKRAAELGLPIRAEDYTEAELSELAATVN